jgi:hypothetical protein
MEKQFLAAGVSVPAHLKTDQFSFVVLEPGVAEEDYEAVMSSKNRLRQVFNENDQWPEDSMTLESNIEDLVQHEAEYNNREGFAYAVLSPCHSRYIGCVYIYPTTVPGYGCEVYLWVRDSEVNLDGALFNQTKRWLAEAWPFGQCAFPGREIAWCDWSGARSW